MKIPFLNNNQQEEDNTSLSLIDTLLKEKEPFIDLNEEVEEEQPLTTKWELWSYYLYYNGVTYPI